MLLIQERKSMYLWKKGNIVCVSNIVFKRVPLGENIKLCFDFAYRNMAYSEKTP